MKTFFDTIWWTAYRGSGTFSMDLVRRLESSGGHFPLFCNDALSGHVVRSVGLQLWARGEAAAELLDLVDASVRFSVELSPSNEYPHPFKDCFIVTKTRNTRLRVHKWNLPRLSPEYYTRFSAYLDLSESTARSLAFYISEGRAETSGLVFARARRQRHF